ncbi:MAG: hypothetical protein PHC64_11260 [Candidatus Gastranaerophilales bacterium]|nr:hypothetical protein [Candidatus Gastranaerophilales bacterium]
MRINPVSYSSVNQNYKNKSLKNPAFGLNSGDTIIRICGGTSVLQIVDDLAGAIGSPVRIKALPGMPPSRAYLIVDSNQSLDGMVLPLVTNANARLRGVGEITVLQRSNRVCH